jgi:hypothetical protein
VSVLVSVVGRGFSANSSPALRPANDTTITGNRPHPRLLYAWVAHLMTQEHSIIGIVLFTLRRPLMATGIQVVFDCADPDSLARFWAEATGYKP